MQPALAIEQLSKTYEGGFQALKDISLTVSRGISLLCSDPMVRVSPPPLALSVLWY